MLDAWWFAYIVLPLLIFGARICDVSLDTMRVIYLNRGGKFIAPLLGFFQAIIWLLAAAQVLQRLNNPLCYIAYGAGFAAGNLIGMLIEEKVAAGLLTVRVITISNASELAQAMRGEGHGVTMINGQGANGPVHVLFVVIRRRHLAGVVRLIREHAPAAFYSTEEVRSITGGTLALSGGARRLRAPFRRQPLP